MRTVNLLRTLHVSFLVPAALVGATMLPLSGCDKAGGTSGGTGPNTSSATANKPTVGIIDYDRVFTDVGWKGELDRSLQATHQEYTMTFQSFIRDVQKAVSDKKKELATKARLNPAQVADLEKNQKVDQLPLSAEQKQELFATLQNAEYYANQANAYATGLFRQRQTQLIGMYKQALNPVIRRVSEANGLSIVLIPLENVAYYGNTADISSKVVDEFQKSPPPRNIPDAPKLTIPWKFESISAPPTPTTAPAALPATQPVSPNRGG